MKKRFPTYIEETAILYDRITVSAGQRGVQISVEPDKLAGYLEAEFALSYKEKAESMEINVKILVKVHTV